METEDKNKALFIDLDGSALRHLGNASNACDPNAVKEENYLLDGVKDKFNEWSSKGYIIVLTTARKESMRQVTEWQLRTVGLFWDLLIMGLGNGERIIINDISPRYNGIKAIGINLKRNEGFENIDNLYHEAKLKAGAPNTDKKYTI